MDKTGSIGMAHLPKESKLVKRNSFLGPINHKIIVTLVRPFPSLLCFDGVV